MGYRKCPSGSVKASQCDKGGYGDGEGDHITHYPIVECEG